MGSIAEAVGPDRESEQEGGPSQPPEQEEQGLEEAAVVEEHPIVEQLDHELTQADKPGDVHPEV